MSGTVGTKAVKTRAAAGRGAQSSGVFGDPCCLQSLSARHSGVEKSRRRLRGHMIWPFTEDKLLTARRAKGRSSSGTAGNALPKLSSQ